MFQSIPKNNDIENQIHFEYHNFYANMISGFTDYEESIMIYEILLRIDHKEPITIINIHQMTLASYQKAAK